MPIHDVGYRRWAGKVMSMFGRCWVISDAGIRINLKNSWVRRTLFLAWMPVIGAGMAIFFGEKLLEYAGNNQAMFARIRQASSSDGPQERSEILDQDGGGSLQRSELESALGGPGGEILRRFDRLSRTFQNFEPVREALISGDENAARKAMWSWVLLNFFRSFQGVSVVLMLGLIVPPLVAQDVRSRAFQLYYARPIGRIDYVVGKLAIPAFFVCLITTLPAMALYVFGVMMSPDLSVIYDTWQIPFQIIVASIALILPTCSLALMFSSLTYESRFAGFAWFTVWGLGLVAWSMIYTVNTARLGENQTYESNWTLVSLYNTLHKSQSWIFGLEKRFDYVAPSLVLLTAITVFSLIILFRRVSAPLRA